MEKETKQTELNEQTEKPTQTKSRDQIFREKARTYAVCYKADCAKRDTCLRWILNDYVPTDTLVKHCVNIRNTQVASGECPMYRNSEPRLMPTGIQTAYYDMPGRIERSIKNALIAAFSRKRYYEYHNGTTPMTPDVEQLVRQTFIDHGWTEEPHFMKYVEEYEW